MPLSATHVKDLAASEFGFTFRRPARKPTKSMYKASVTPIYVVRLDNAHAVMLTHTLPVDDHGEPMTCHACTNSNRHPAIPITPILAQTTIPLHIT